jgi:hypothetical protein
MTRPVTVSLFSLRRWTVDALTAFAALALALAALNGTIDALQQVLVAAVLMATGAMLEPQPVLRRSERRVRHTLRASAVPA